MDTNALKKFAQEARRKLLAQVETRLEQVLSVDSVELREKLGVVNQLRTQIEQKGRQNVIEEVAYTWFNRLCALRYMDVNRYTRVGVVSPVEGFTQPEILQNAKQGIFEPDWPVDRNRVQGLLNGRLSASNPEQEAYRLLLVAVCNAYAREMEFLFKAIEDYSELLMPVDLLSNQSVLHAVREALTPETCVDVEVIGWLYQFYISEKKDQVMSAKGAVKKEDIPAVTQLFTPDWIVRYMVQNSLGRLWLLNHPSSKIREQMEYYIPPAEPETNYLRVSSPEELKVLDPACGSGHILTYAFDLLVAIYEEQGYDALSIPKLILQKNLYGIEIDKRAAMLSSFALMMKALQKDRRFFKRDVKPNILEMVDVSFSAQEIKAYIQKVGQDLWTQELWEGLKQFENAKTFGSLIRPVIRDAGYLRQRMGEKGVFEDLFLSHTNNKLLQVLEMAEYLSPRYQVVVANPPYFGKGMDTEFKQFANENYPDTKTDTFAMFIERLKELSLYGGLIGMMTPFNWMFLSSFEKIRSRIITESTLLSLIRPEFHAFFDSAFVSVCSFVFNTKPNISYKGYFIDLNDFYGAEIQAIKTKEAIINPMCGWSFFASAKDFMKIPGAPIAYSASEAVRQIFQQFSPLSRIGEIKKGLSTSNDQEFVRYWFEVSNNKICFFSKEKNSRKWIPLNKGGSYRRWYGNRSHVINWENGGKKLKEYPSSVIRNEKYYGKDMISWSMISSSFLGVRYYGTGFIFEGAGPSLFIDQGKWEVLAYLESKIASNFIKLINPTMNININDVGNLPFPANFSALKLQDLVKATIAISKDDWDSSELSWDYQISPLASLKTDNNIAQKYGELISGWEKILLRMKNLEEKNHRVFIETYRLQDEISPEMPLEEITLNCNPHYRYKGDYNDEEREARLLEDTMKEFISYSVGCMFGRYSLDKPGLILANQGETLADYLRIIEKEPLFTPTESNVIPILEGDWFPDDITLRFKQFLKLTFGEQNYDENLRFIEDALGKDVRKYFLKDFYKDHVQTYKKRPIYWLFSSPKGSFNALVYMHRYTPGTASVVLNQYLREYIFKLTAHRRQLESQAGSKNASQREKTLAEKEIEQIGKVLLELKDYENNTLFPLATQRIAIDLDDGVLVNYAKFGEALRQIY